MSSHVILVHDQANTNFIAKAASNFFVVRRWHANVVLLELLDNLIAAFFAIDYFQFSFVSLLLYNYPRIVWIELHLSLLLYRTDSDGRGRIWYFWLAFGMGKAR